MPTETKKPDATQTSKPKTPKPGDDTFTLPALPDYTDAEPPDLDPETLDFCTLVAQAGGVLCYNWLYHLARPQRNNLIMAYKRLCLRVDQTIQSALARMSTIKPHERLEYIQRFQDLRKDLVQFVETTWDKPRVNQAVLHRLELEHADLFRQYALYIKTETAEINTRLFPDTLKFTAIRDNKPPAPRRGRRLLEKIGLMPAKKSKLESSVNPGDDEWTLPPLIGAPDPDAPAMGREFRRFSELAVRLSSVVIYVGKHVISGHPLSRKKLNNLLSASYNECAAVEASLVKTLARMSYVDHNDRLQLSQRFHKWWKDAMEAVEVSLLDESRMVTDSFRTKLFNEFTELFSLYASYRMFEDNALLQPHDRKMRYFFGNIEDELPEDEKITPDMWEHLRGISAQVFGTTTQGDESSAPKGDEHTKVSETIDEAYIPFTKAIELGNGILTRKKLEKAIKKGKPVKVRDRKPSPQRREVHIQDVLNLMQELCVSKGATEEASQMFSEWKNMYLNRQADPDLR